MDNLEPSLGELRQILESHPAGPIKDTTDLERTLAASWEKFRSSSDSGMLGHKLFGRMEDVEWDPPNLRFRIERHGGTVMGSTRAEVHEWCLNLNSLDSSCLLAGSRKVHYTAPPVKITPLVEEIHKLILSGATSPCLTWLDKDTVKLNIRNPIAGERSRKADG